MTEPAQKPGRSKQDYATPQEFIDAVERRFGFIGWDLAASADNVKGDARGFFDEGDDSLTKPWADIATMRYLWLNPPFGRIAEFAAKCAEESAKGARIIMLVPAAIGSNWFAEHVLRKAMVLGLAPRITFEGTKEPYPKDLMLCVYANGLHGFDQWRWKQRKKR